jgi:hypothetical protein
LADNSTHACPVLAAGENVLTNCDVLCCAVLFAVDHECGHPQEDDEEQETAEDAADSRHKHGHQITLHAGGGGTCTLLFL